jgi:predicted 3-demethylubiquinone-9 3-methyltransferase (glyoxalase superfamily)
VHARALRPVDVLTVEFTQDDQAYTGLIGGPQFQFDESASFQ